MEKLVSSLVVGFILIMTLAGGCVRSVADDRAGPVVSAAYPVASLEDPQELQRFLDELYAERMAEYQILGETAAVVRDGRILSAKGYGYADSEKRVPVDPERTLLRIGSVSKLFVKGEFVSEITAFEPPWLLELVWTGPAMTGRDRYELGEAQDGTKLLHQKWTSPRGPLRMMEPIMRRALLPRLEERLSAIKRALEEGQGPVPESSSLRKDR